jgi:hypothetical protein
MDPLAKLILSVSFGTMVIIYWLDYRQHRRHDKTEEHVKGVRIRMERGFDEAAYESEKDRAENKRLRASIYRQFKEWLQHMRGP